MTTENMPEQGKLWICYRVDGTHIFRLCMGIVTKISMSYAKSTNVIPIVTKRAEEAFPLDMGVRKTYSLNGYRLQPTAITDGSGNGIYGASDALDDIAEEQSRWSCEKWFDIAMGAVNRWQMKTDGCWLEYYPEDTNPYISLGRDGYVHGYIGSLEITYNTDLNEALSFYLTFTVGTMYVLRDDQHESTEPEEPDHLCPPFIPFSESSISISSADRKSWYLVGSLDDAIPSAVESYTIYGGPGEPFERISMTLSVNKLMEVAPELLDVDDENHVLTPESETEAVRGHRIANGESVISVNAVGRATFLVSRSPMSSDGKKIEIKGYCMATAYKTRTLSSSITGTPYYILDSILTDASYGLRFENRGRVTNVDLPNIGPQNQMTFKRDTPVWYAMKVCALLLGCRIFFANDKAYIIDYRVCKDDAVYPTYQGGVQDDWSQDDICTYEDDADNNDNAIDVKPSDPSDFMYSRTLSSSFGGGGSESACQKVVINCSTDPTMTEQDQYSMTDPNAEEGTDVSSTTLTIRELMMSGSSTVNAESFAEAYLDYMSEPQTAVELKVKECTMSENVPGWRSLFATVSQADSIYDSSRDMNRVVTNLSRYETAGRHPRKYQKLYMYTYERSYPEMTTRYEWGVIGEIDLSNTLASEL